MRHSELGEIAMADELKGTKVALLVANGFEQVELTEPKRALEQVGATALVVSPEKGKVKGWKLSQWGDEFPVDVPLSEAKAEEFDALVLPGGVMSPDRLRRNEWALQFVRAFFDSGKPICAICHGPWTLIDADVVAGRKMTSYPSIQTDLKNAGANWVDEEVVVDNGLVTSRGPNDLPAFNRKMIEEIAEEAHAPPA
jgi:deglycase